MADAIEVARHLIHLAAQEPEPDTLNPLRLQKLLYYAQGWSLGLRGKPLFEERIEAWVHGPVVPSVYHAFSAYGYESIPPDKVPQASLSRAEADFVEAVWQAYRAYSATSLRDMTHKEAPWVNARGRRAPAEACDEEITQAAMKIHFARLAKKK